MNTLIGIIVLSGAFCAVIFALYDLACWLFAPREKEESASAHWLEVKNQHAREIHRLREEMSAQADHRHRETIRAIRVEEQKRIRAHKQEHDARAQPAPSDAPNSAGGTHPQAAPLDARLSGSQARSVQTPNSASSD